MSYYNTKKDFFSFFLDFFFHLIHVQQYEKHLLLFPGCFRTTNYYCIRKVVVTMPFLSHSMSSCKEKTRTSIINTHKHTHMRYLLTPSISVCKKPKRTRFFSSHIHTYLWKWECLRILISYSLMNIKKKKKMCERTYRLFWQMWFSFLKDLYGRMMNELKYNIWLNSWWSLL
jgi:hypothetical protein